MIQITKISNVYSGNYEANRTSIKNIVIGLTNDNHSGYGYAKTYKKVMKTPIRSYHYIVDKNGLVYQTIDDTMTAFAISSERDNFYNLRSISICMMPVWDGGDDAYEDLVEGTSFPSRAADGDYFYLKKKKGSYEVGIYRYEDSGDGIWVYVGPRNEKKPISSDGWIFNDATIRTTEKLVKWLMYKYNIQLGDVLRVYDIYRENNPFPFIHDNEGDWQTFKDDINDIKLEAFNVKDEPLDPIVDFDEPKATEQELIEKYGPNAKSEETIEEGNAINDNPPINTDGFTFEMAFRDSNTWSKKPTTTLSRLNNVVTELTWDSHINGSMGELNFDYYRRNSDGSLVNIEEGYNVGYIINGQPSFNGNVFKIKQKSDRKDMLTVRCLDSFKYLNNEGFLEFKGMTASEMFDKACNSMQIPHKVITPSTYKCKDYFCYGESMYKVIDKGIAETMAYGNKWYIIQDNFGILEFRDILDKDNIKQLKFSEGSAVINWDFETSIEDTANIIYCYVKGEGQGENKEISQSDVKSSKDQSTIEKWGALSKVFEINKDNAGQLQKHADDQLRFWNSPRRTMKLVCQGIAGVMAGNIIYLDIADVVGVGHIQGCLVVDDCTHTISNGKWQMELTCEIVQDGAFRDIIYNAITNKIEVNGKEFDLNEVISKSTTNA